MWRSEESPLRVICEWPYVSSNGNSDFKTIKVLLESWLGSLPLNQGLWERGSVGTSFRGPESKEGACKSLKGPIALAIDVNLFWFFDCFGFFLFSTIFSLYWLFFRQLKQVTPCCINWICLSLLCIKYMLSGHSAAQEIKHLWKFTSGFYWTLNPQFWEKSQPVHGAPKQSCTTLQHLSWRPCFQYKGIYKQTWRMCWLFQFTTSMIGW